MKPSFKNKRSGGSSGWRGGKGGGAPMLYTATCAACGNSCQVPFKPNGRKPVYCSNCFKRDDRDPREDRPTFSDHRASNSSMEARLVAIEAKIDSIIEALTDEEEE